MRVPKSTQTPEYKAAQASFDAVKAFAGVDTMLDEGFNEVFKKYRATYKPGMTPDQAVEAFKAIAK